MKPNPLPGEVWTVDLGCDGEARRAVVVSNPERNCRLAIASVMQVTTQFAGTPYEITLPRVTWLREQSYYNAQTVQPVAWVEFQRKLGQLDARVLKDIRAAIRAWLDL